MDDLTNAPEYEIRWPTEVLAFALDRLISRAPAHAHGPDKGWQDEVETLLGQAFTSGVPLQDFREQWDRSPRQYDDDEEPF